MNEQVSDQPAVSQPATPPTGPQVPFGAILTEIVKRVQSPIILGAMAFIALLFGGLFLTPAILDKAPALPWGVLGFGLFVLLLTVVPEAYLKAREQAHREWQERDKARRLAEAAHARRERAVVARRPAETPAPAKAPLTAETLFPTPSSLPRDLDALRKLYLREVFADCRPLQLHTIDLRTATGAREAAELELAAVFTDLDVIERSRESPHPLAPSPKDWERGKPEAETRLPALAALSRYRRLALRGDPGSGKSTLVNFVALCLAGDGLADPAVNLKRLGDAWTLPRLLPLRIVLRDYAARGLPQERSLYQFFQDELAGRCRSDGSTLAGCAAVVEAALKRENGALLMLDGVDEVPEAHARRLQLKAAVERFARDFPGCRILVTSRPYAYQPPARPADPDPRPSGFEVRDLADFTLDGQVPAFIDRWYAHVGEKDRSLGKERAKRYAEQLKAEIERLPRLADLALRPLLLTLMASLHRWREGGSLPQKRQELYEACVVLLLELWQRTKPRYDEQGRLVGEERDVWTELGIPADKLRAALNQIAYEAHRDAPNLEVTHDIRARDLAGVLYEAATDKGKAQGEQRIIQYLTDRAGLLIERAQRSVYAFPHRTFQEYLAACYLADEDFPFLLADQLREDDERWREAALLAAAKNAGGANIWNLIGGFCPHDYPLPQPPANPDWYAALRAAQALVETEKYLNVPDRQRDLVDRLRDWLAALLEKSPLPAPERAAAGNALAVLDDPRPGVGLLSPSPDLCERVSGGEGFPDILWCYVPKGPFLMGSSKEDVAWLERETDYTWNEETPQRQRDIPYDYWITRYLVTNAQFRAFVDDRENGYTCDDWWTQAGFKWRERSGGWERYGGVFDLSNHPAVGVCWYEAAAYCAWLTVRMQDAGGMPAGWKIRLPTEAEWEKAARGGLEIPPIPIIVDDLQSTIYNPQSAIPNPRPARRFPWGQTPALDAPDPNRANYGKSGVGATSAVGAFPGSVSPYGCLDMSGNVWEWCGTKWVDNYAKYDKIEGREALEGDDTRVLRGGSWYNFWNGARCAWRHWFNPHYRLIDWGFRVCVSTSFSLPS